MNTQRLRGRLVVLVVTGLLVALASPALGSTQSSEVTTERDLALSGTVSSSELGLAAPSGPQKLTEVEDNFGLRGESKVVLVPEETTSLSGPEKPGVIQPQFKVELGWNFYVYLDRGDWLYLGGLGRTVATAVLCGWLAATVMGAIACAAASYIVGTYILQRSAPKAGYCARIVINYAGIPTGFSYVKRTC